MSSKPKPLVPPLKISFRRRLKGEPLVLSPPAVEGSIICLKLNRIGFTADIMFGI